MIEGVAGNALTPTDLDDALPFQQAFQGEQSAAAGVLLMFVVQFHPHVRVFGRMLMDAMSTVHGDLSVQSRGDGVQFWMQTGVKKITNLQAVLF